MNIQTLIYLLNIFVLSLCSTLSPTDNPNFYSRSNNSLRVIRGKPAKLGDFPYQVSFKKGGPIYFNFCGGSIIKPTVVLSAAHCFAETNSDFCASLWRGKVTARRYSDTHVVAANLKNAVRKTSESKPDGQWRTIKKVAYPRRYKFPAQDIAIVTINQQWDFNKHVGIINTAIRPMDYARFHCFASGYGRTETGRAADVLMHASLTVVAVRRCTRLIRQSSRPFVCTSNRLTAVHQGDSGGPLVCKNTRDPKERSMGVLVGITCAGSGHIDLFTRVSSYRAYINRNDSNIIKPIITMLLIAFIHFLI